MLPSCLLFLFLLFLLSSTAGAFQYFVSDDNGVDSVDCGSELAPCHTMFYVLNNMPFVTGDEIVVFPGVYTGSENLGQDLDWLGNVASDDEGNRVLTVRGKDVGRFDTVIFDGEETYQAVYLQPAPETYLVRFVDLTFHRCLSAAQGGAVFSDNHPVYFENVRFYQNRATGTIPSGQGGAVYLRADDYSLPITFLKCIFEENESEAPGGALVLYARTGGLFDSCIFANNSAASAMWAGAVLLEDQSAPEFRSCVFHNNFASFGGAVDDGGTASGKFHDCVFVQNRAKYGGAYYAYQESTTSFTGCLFDDNVVEQSGGALRFTSSTHARVTDCTVRDSKGVDGTAFYISDMASVTIENCTFESHEEITRGGIFHITTSGTVDISNITVRNNTVKNASLFHVRQGSVFLRGATVQYNVGLSGTVFTLESPGLDQTYRIVDSVFNYNTAITDASFAIVRNAAMVLDNVTVSDHFGRGATIYIDQHGTIDVQNSLFERNIVSSLTASAGNGGVFALNDEGQLHVAHSTFRHNKASGHGGVMFSDAEEGVVVGHNVVLDGNLAGGNGGAMYFGGQGNATYLTMINNRATYGGGAFIFGHDSNVLEHLNLSNNTALRGGGGFYYDYIITSTAFDSCLHCDVHGNRASYGPDIASQPAAISVSDARTYSLMRGDTISVVVSLVDSFGQVVVDNNAYPDVATVPSDGLTILSGRRVQRVSMGYATFDSIELTGDVGREYFLNFTSKGLESRDAAVLVSFIPCQAGYEEVTVDEVTYCRACAEGTYNPFPNAACLPCPRHGYCPGGHNGTEVLVTRHSWLDPTTLPTPTLYSCANDHCCPNSMDPPCEYKNQCVEHRVGVMCAECVDGYSEWGGECTACEHSDALMVTLVVLYYLIVLVIMLFKDPARRPEASIAIFSLQTMGLISSLVRKSSLELAGSSTDAFFSVPGVVSFNIDHLTAAVGLSRCLFKASLLHIRVYNLLAPLVLFAAMGILYLSRVWWAKQNLRRVKPIRQHFTRSLLNLTAFLSTPMSTATLSLLRCMTVRDTLVLVASPEDECVGTAFFLALVMLIFVVVGYPAITSLFLFRRRHKLYDENGRTHPAYGMLYEPYKPAYYLTDAVYLLRRTLLALIVVLFSDEDDEMWRVSLVCFMVVLMLVGQAIVQPYASRSVNYQETIWLSLICLLAIAEALTAAADYITEPDLFQSQVSFLFVVIVLGSLSLLIHVGRNVLTERVLAMYGRYRDAVKHPKLPHTVHGRGSDKTQLAGTFFNPKKLPPVELPMNTLRRGRETTFFRSGDLALPPPLLEDPMLPDNTGDESDRACNAETKEPAALDSTRHSLESEDSLSTRERQHYPGASSGDDSKKQKWEKKGKRGKHLSTEDWYVRF
eukprot:Rmarinus@m.19636